MDSAVDKVFDSGAVLRGFIAANILTIDVAHFVVMAVSVRDEYGVRWSRAHPLACWLSTMMCSFSGTFLTNLLLGESLLAPFTAHYDLLVSTTIWYLVNFAPFDAMHSAFSRFPVKLTLNLVKELQRTHKVYLGVASGRKLFPEEVGLHVLVGTTKGAGSGVLKSAQQWLHGSWRPGENEILKPSTTSKATILSALLFALNPIIDADLAYLCSACIMVGCKTLSLCGLTKTPFSPIENVICNIAFGLPPTSDHGTITDTEYEEKKSTDWMSKGTTTIPSIPTEGIESRRRRKWYTNGNKR